MPKLRKALHWWSLLLSVSNEDPNLNGVVLDDAIGNHIERMKMFILTEGVHNIAPHRLSASCALVLSSKALLCFIYANAIYHIFLPDKFKNRIKNNLSGGLTALSCPLLTMSISIRFGECWLSLKVIKEVFLLIELMNMLMLVILQLLVGEDEGDQQRAGIHAQSLAIHSLATQIWRELHEIKMVQVSDTASMQRNYTIVNSNVRRLAMAPAQVITRAGAASGGSDDTNIAGIIRKMQGAPLLLV
jgi:hypothetical protein